MKYLAYFIVCAAASMSVGLAFAQTSGGTGSTGTQGTTTVPSITGIQPGATAPGIIPPNSTNQSAIGTILDNDTRPIIAVPPNPSLSPVGPAQPSTNQTQIQPGAAVQNQPQGMLQPNAAINPPSSPLSPIPGQIIPPNPVEGSLQPQP